MFNIHIQHSDTCFPFVEPNIPLLPQGSLASIPSNALITVTKPMHVNFQVAHVVALASLYQDEFDMKDVG